MPKTAEPPGLSLRLVEVLNALWTQQNGLRGLADQAQWAAQDACAALGMTLQDAAPEVRARADALAAAAIADEVRALAERLRLIAASLEEAVA